MNPPKSKPLGKYFLFLLTLLILLILVPVFDDDQWGAPTTGVVTMLTMIFGLNSVAQERRTLSIAIGLGIIAYGLTTWAWISGGTYILALPFQLAFFLFINLSILRTVLETKDINADVVCGGIAVYLLLGVNWTIVFMTIEFISPGSIVVLNSMDKSPLESPMDFLYFTFVTLTTLGYGDIAPVSNAARSASIGAAVSGTLYIAVFIGRLVGLTTTQVHRD
ncbi:MAG: potassium channel family protein [Puniceicoccales bacterium]